MNAAVGEAQFRQQYPYHYMWFSHLRDWVREQARNGNRGASDLEVDKLIESKLFPVLEEVPPAQMLRTDAPDRIRELAILALALGFDVRPWLEPKCGGFGSVYRVFDRRGDVTRVLAVKLLPRACHIELRSQTTEISTAVQVLHPSVVEIHDFGVVDRKLWFSMPYYGDCSLADRVSQTPDGLGHDEAARIFETLADALASVHACGIVHGDIKPGNVMLVDVRGSCEGAHRSVKRRYPVLIDFGLAQAKERLGMLGGTLRYMAPEILEQLKESGTITSSCEADVYSLALALREALEPASMKTWLESACSSWKPPPPFVAPNLRHVNKDLERWLAEDPNKRPHAEEFAKLIHAALITEPRRRAVRGRTRFQRALLLAIVVILALAYAFASTKVDQLKAEGERRAAVNQARTESERQVKAELDRKAAVERANIAAKIAQKEAEAVEARLAAARKETAISELVDDLDTITRDRKRLAESNKGKDDTIEGLKRENDKLIRQVRASIDVATALRGDLTGCEADRGTLEVDLRTCKSGLIQCSTQRTELTTCRTALEDCNGRVEQLRMECPPPATPNQNDVAPAPPTNSKGTP